MAKFSKIKKFLPIDITHPMLYTHKPHTAFACMWMLFAVRIHGVCEIYLGSFFFGASKRIQSAEG